MIINNSDSFYSPKIIHLRNKKLGRKIWNGLKGILSYGSYMDRSLQLIPSGTKSGNFLGV